MKKNEEKKYGRNQKKLIRSSNVVWEDESPSSTFLLVTLLRRSKRAMYPPRCALYSMSLTSI
jgi:hypothetical protein